MRNHRTSVDAAKKFINGQSDVVINWSGGRKCTTRIIIFPGSALYPLSAAESLGCYVDPTIYPPKSHHASGGIGVLGFFFQINRHSFMVGSDKHKPFFLFVYGFGVGTTESNVYLRLPPSQAFRLPFTAKLADTLRTPVIVKEDDIDLGEIGPARSL